MPEEVAPDPEEGDKSFTQADLDRIVADRLAREKAKYADYADLKAKAKQFDDVEAASKSEAQKLADKAAEAESRAAEAEGKLLRLTVANEKGLTPAQAKRLVGATQEELEADADEILEAFPAATGGAAPPPGRKPTADLKGGGNPDNGSSAGTAETDFEKALSAQMGR